MEHGERRRAPPGRIERILVILLLLATFLSYAFTIRPGHEWGDDFAMYIHHAWNIVHGVDYKATGYLYDPGNPVLGPRYYPPIFPLLLAPVIAVFGINLTAMRIEIVVLWVLTLAAIYGAFRRDLPSPLLLCALLLLAATPTLWKYKNHVLSDIPFLLFSTLALWRIQRAYDEGRRGIPEALAIGALIYLACGTRMVGVVLVPALLVMDVLSTKRLTAFPWIAVATFAILYAAQRAWIPGSEGYSDQFGFSFARVADNLRNLRFDLFGVWNNTFSRAFALALKGILVALAAIGIFSRVKRRVSIYEIFIPIYLLVVGTWTWDAVRYTLPVLPLFIIYVFSGVAVVTDRLRSLPWMRWAVPAALVAGSAVSYASVYATCTLAPVDWGADTPRSRELYAYIRSHTPSDAALLFFKPRALALYTARRASTYPKSIDDSYVEKLIDRTGASYIVETRARDALWSYVSHHPGEADSIWTNGEFTVVRLLRAALPDPGDRSP